MPDDSISFYESVYKIVASIPAGMVVSYGEIARALGRPRAAKTVGWAMRAAGGRNLPTHRVVCSDGRLAIPDDLQPSLQRILLSDEGIQFTLDGRVDMHLHSWKCSPHPK